MTLRRGVVAACAVAVLAGCSAPAAPVPAAGLDPLTAAELDFVDRVSAIAPPLAENPERLARRGGNSCSSIERGAEVAVPQAVERFSGPSYAVSVDQAERIIEAATETVCAASE